MRTLHVPPELQANLASHVFEGEADLWWGIICAQYNIEEMNFEDFEQLFLKRYFPDAMKHTKIQEFLDLKQENMTVAEYVAKFTKLSKYSDGIANDQKTKAIEFR
ncbi:hypothetical protein ACFXTI_014498 [Malus domestica]